MYNMNDACTRQWAHGNLWHFDPCGSGWIWGDLVLVRFVMPRE